MTDIAIVAAVRTPVGSFRGAFAPLSAVDLGAAVVRSLLERCQLPAAAVDELIFGQVLTAGCGQNPARQTALRAGLPVDTPAVTVNLVCGSGLKAVQQAVQAIRCGDAEIVIAGGQESMSNAPYLMNGARDGLRFGHASLQDSMIQDGLWDALTTTTWASPPRTSPTPSTSAASARTPSPPAPSAKRRPLSPPDAFARRSSRSASRRAKSRRVS
jgi:acetyl-CoA C-acetyltransferase